MLPNETLVREQISNRLTLVDHKGQVVLIISYANSKEMDMIGTFNTAKDFVMNHGQQVSVVSIFENNYVTSQFMRHLETELTEAEPLIKKNVVTGLTEVQLWILKGVNLWSKKKIKNFTSLAQALDFVTSDSK